MNTKYLGGKYPQNLQSKILIRFLGTQGMDDLMVKYAENKKKTNLFRVYTTEDYQILDDFQAGKLSMKEIQTLWEIKSLEAVYRRIGKLIEQKRNNCN